jgi:hypothetical protein
VELHLQERPGSRQSKKPQIGGVKEANEMMALQEDDVDVVVDSLEQDLAVEIDDFALLCCTKSSHKGFEEIGAAIVLK